MFYISFFQVLTHNVATSLGIADVEKKLDESPEEKKQSFLDYCSFMEREVFSLLPVNNQSVCVDTEPPIYQKQKFDKIDEICWFLCAAKYNSRKNKKLSDTISYKLWQIFNIVADCDSDGTVCYPVTSHPHEVLLLMQKMTAYIENVTLDQVDLPQASYSFPQLLDVIESGPLQMSEQELESTIQEIHREVVVEVIKEVICVALERFRCQFPCLTCNIIKMTQTTTIFSKLTSSCRR